jgi:hypothetical protein
MPKENSVNDDTQDGEHSTTERTPIDIEASEQALSTFKSLLKTALHPRELEMWVMDSVLRQNLFADLAIGQVKWPKALGRPAGPDLSVGFVFEAQFWVDIWHIGLDGSIITDKQGWVAGDTPAVWDGPDDPDHYAVKYLFYAANQNDNLVGVRFSEAPWHHLEHSGHRHSRRYLSDTGWQFYSAGTFTVLPDITLGTRPSFHA